MKFICFAFTNSTIFFNNTCTVSPTNVCLPKHQQISAFISLHSQCLNGQILIHKQNYVIAAV